MLATLTIGLVTAMTVDPHQNWLALGTSLGYHLIWDMRFQLPIRHWQHTGHGGTSEYCVGVCNVVFHALRIYAMIEWNHR